MEVYLESVDPTQFCMCSVSPVPQCDDCVQRFQSRKEAALEAIDRLSVSQMNIFPNQQFLPELLNEMRSAINAFDLPEACTAMGLCGESTTQDIDNYEAAFVEETSQGFCSMLGPLSTLCQQVIQGHSVDIQGINLNANDLDETFATCDMGADGEKVDEPVVTGQHFQREESEDDMFVLR